MDEDGSFPEGTINRRIVDRLDSMAETQRDFNRPPELPAGDEQDQEEAGG